MKNEFYDNYEKNEYLLNAMIEIGKPVFFFFVF